MSAGQGQEDQPRSRPATAKPVGFWKVPPEAWSDEQAMDEFAQRVLDQIKAAHERAEADRETSES